MENNTSLNFNPVIFSGSKLIDSSYVGISQWYRYGNNAINATYKNPENENPTPSTYSLNRVATINQEYGAGRWSWIESLKGQYDYTQLTIDDNYTQYWKSLGKDIIFEIGYTPGWANTGCITPGGYLGSLSSSTIPCATGSNIVFKIVDNKVPTEWNTSATFRKRWTIISQANPTVQMSGRGYFHSTASVSDITITTGTGATSGTWTTTGGTGSGAAGTFTASAGVIVSWVITNPGYTYNGTEAIIASTGSLGTNVLTIVPGTVLRINIDAVVGSGTYSDWFIHDDYGNFAPTDMADFADWCEFIFARNERAFTTAGATLCGWGGAVRYWQLRNEPAFQVTSNAAGQYFRDTPEKYAEMLRVASQIGKKYSPLNKIYGSDCPYPSNSSNALQYTVSSSTSNTITFSTSTKNNIKGWYAFNASIPRNTTVVSGQGTNTLTLSKNVTSPTGLVYFRAQQLGSTNSELLFVSAAGFDLTPYGISTNPTGAGTLAHQWMDIISTHGYTGNVFDSPDVELDSYFEWRKLRNYLDANGLTHDLYQTEVMQKHNVTPYQFGEDLIRMKRSFLLAIFAGGCRHWVWFGWGPGAATWNQAGANGVAARAAWYNFFTGLFASPVTRVTMDYITKKITVTQANGTVTVV